MSYKIASFNVKNLSYGSGRDLEKLAEIINDNELDIVALQEVLSEGKALTGINSSKATGQARIVEKSLIRYLRGQWGIAWCDPRTNAKSYPYLGEDARGEGYAFLWRKSKFELPVNEKTGKEILPKIWRNYHPNKSDGQIRLIREPCYGRFKVKRCNAEIRLITTHIIYGKPKDNNLSVDLDVGAISMRKNEFDVLAGKIYTRINEDHVDVHCRIPYTIILGDYNLNLSDKGALNYVALYDEHGHRVLDENTAYSKIYTVQEELTTLKRDEDGYANNYDHFSYDERTKSHVIVPGSARRVNAVEQTHRSGRSMYAEYKEDVSDHVPIVIEVDFRKGR